MTTQRFAIGTVVGGLVLFFLGYLVFGVVFADFFAANAGTATGVQKEPFDFVSLAIASAGVGRGADAHPGLGQCLERGSGRQGLRAHWPAALLRLRPDDVCDVKHLDAEGRRRGPDSRCRSIRGGRSGIAALMPTA